MYFYLLIMEEAWELLDEVDWNFLPVFLSLSLWLCGWGQKIPLAWEQLQTYSYGSFSFCMPGARSIVPAEHGSSINIEAADAKQMPKPLLISERR